MNIMVHQQTISHTLLHGSLVNFQGGETYKFPGNLQSNGRPVLSMRVTMAAKIPEQVFPEFTTACLREDIKLEIPEMYQEFELLKEILELPQRRPHL